MSYSIKQASNLSGLSTKAIRFYEEKGIIKNVYRAQNGYRQYTEDEIEQLRNIRKIKDLGLPLSEIKKLLNGCSDGQCHHSPTETLNNLNTYLSLLNRQIKELNVLKNKLYKLTLSIKNQGPNQQFCCDYLHQLINIPEGGDI